MFCAAVWESSFEKTEKEWYNKISFVLGRTHMIRLIASDMDGSLLDDQKQIPPEFYKILPRLQEKGITFVVASGRSYVTLKKNFASVSEDIGYICDNGAYVMNGGSASINIIPQNLLRPLIQACSELQGIQVVLCGVHATHHKAYNPEFNFEIGSYYVNRRIVEDLSQVEDDIFKVAICDMNNPETGTYPLLAERFSDSLTLQISGKYWMDVMNTGINKGVALSKIQSQMGITPEETMAFGDFYNDIELLSRAQYSFVMENSNEDMRQYGNFVALSNNEAGVIKAIEKYVLC